MARQFETIRQDAQAVIQQQLAQVGIRVETSKLTNLILYFSATVKVARQQTEQIDIMEWSDGPSFPDPDIYYWLCSEIPSR